MQSNASFGGFQLPSCFARHAKVRGEWLLWYPLLAWLTWAASVFIAEITARAFIIADSNKRRTLSRSDIAKALSKSDQFDFLIDIVPRDELPFPTAGSNTTGTKKLSTISTLQHDQVSGIRKSLWYISE